MPRQIYRIGNDIYNAATNQRIGSTDWAQNWSGRSDVQDLGQRQQTPPPVATPAQETPADVYAGIIPNETPEEKALRLERERQGSSYMSDANQNVDENTIRQNVLNKFQAEIDALNRIYAEKKSEERRRGEGRLGSDAAIQARRGLLGSTFGTAQTRGVENLNAEAQSAIDSEQAVMISSIMTKVNQDVADEVAAKTKARQEGAEKYIKFLEESADRAKTRVSEAVQNLLKVSGDINWGDAKLKDIADSLGTTVENLKRLYNTGKEELAAQKAETEFKRRTTLKAGEKVYDSSGKLLFSAPEEPKNVMDYVKEVDGNLLQYDPDTKSWTTIYQKNESPDNLTIEQKLALEKAGKMIDANGNLVDKPTQLKQDYIDSLQTKYDDINDLLGDSYSREAVGIGFFDSRDFNPFNKSKRANFIAGVQQLIDQKTLDTLVALKAAGGTLGAISEKELSILQKSATKINSWADRDKSGNIKGFKIGDADFKAELKKVQDSYKKIIDAAKTQGSQAETTTPSQKIDQYYNENPDSRDYIDQLDEQGYSDEDKLQILGISFNEVGGDTDRIATAIGKFESGGNYKAIGPDTGNGNRAYGKYQIMASNIPSWSKEALGYSITPQQFLNNPQLQDKIAKHKMGQYLKQYGTVEDVASVWFSGRPLAKAGNAKDVIGTSVPKYVKNVRAIYNSLG